MPGNTDHNLWRGSEYVRGKGVLLCLRNTYAASTHPATPPDIYEREKDLRVAWNQVLEYLNR